MYLEISNPMDYHVGLYIRLSKEDENEGPSESVNNQRSMLEEFVKQHRLSVFDTYVDATVIIGLKQNPTYGRRFSPIFLFIRAFCGAKRKMLL